MIWPGLKCAAMAQSVSNVNCVWFIPTRNGCSATRVAIDSVSILFLFFAGGLVSVFIGLFVLLPSRIPSRAALVVCQARTKIRTRRADVCIWDVESAYEFRWSLLQPDGSLHALAWRFRFHAAQIKSCSFSRT